MLNTGDLFATNGRGFLPRAIRIAEWFWSDDNEATYNHVGVIITSDAKTLEAQWRFKQFDLADYIGRPVLIVRHKDMTYDRFLMGYMVVKKEIGCLYPFWRLPLHLIHISKFFAFGPGVCSEQTAKFMKAAGFKNVVYGITPDELADKWRIDRDMTTIFEGVLTKKSLTRLKEGE